MPGNPKFRAILNELTELSVMSYAELETKHGVFVKKTEENDQHWKDANKFAYNFLIENGMEAAEKLIEDIKARQQAEYEFEREEKRRGQWSDWEEEFCCYDDDRYGIVTGKQLNFHLLFHHNYQNHYH